MEIGDVSPIFPTNVDSTMMACAKSCEQRFFNEYCLRIAPRGIAPHLHAGGAFATGIEAVRRAFYAEGKSLDESIQAAVYPFLKYWGVYTPEEGSGAENKDMINMFVALVEYFKHWNPERDILKPMMRDGIPALEFTFAMPTDVAHPITGDPVLYAGRCDMIGEYEGFIAPVDEKTTKGMGPTWASQWNLRGQFMGYIRAVQQHGFICNHAVARGVAILKTEYKFAEAFTNYPDWLIEQWWLQMNIKLQQLVDRWREMTSFIERHGDPELYWHEFWHYDFADACGSYGGCSFKGLCRQSDKSAWYGDYDRRVWDPLKKDPTEGSVTRLPNDEAQVDPELLAQLGIKL